MKNNKQPINYSTGEPHMSCLSVELEGRERKEQMKGACVSCANMSCLSVELHGREREVQMKGACVSCAKEWG